MLVTEWTKNSEKFRDKLLFIMANLSDGAGMEGWG